jgi:hypothetical protein
MGHVQNFAQLTLPLTALTNKECSWKGGQLPPNPLQAFLELQTYLCSEPIVDYPRNNRPYVLIVDASLGDDKKPGDLGAWGPSSPRSTRMDSTVSLLMPAESCKNTNAFICRFCWKC